MANARVAYFLAAILVLIVAVASYAVAVYLERHKVHEFAGLSGPAGRAVVAPSAVTSWELYDSGSPSRLAVLLTDPESSWLGLAHALKSFGIPFRITTDASEALRHKVVLVYPRISGKVLSAADLRALAAFPRDGGYLIGVNVLGGGLNEVFGFVEAVESRGRYGLRIAQANSPLLADFTHANEQTIPLGNAEKHGKIIGTLGYSEPREAPLAVYDDDSAAIIHRSYGDGRAFAFGFDIGDFFFRAHHARHYAANRSYVNAFEPSADVVARVIRNIYLQGNPDTALIGTVPEDRDLSVMFSYDVDARESFEHMVVYAELLRSAGIRGTFYIQTKYIADFNDIVLFDDAAVRQVRELERLGMEVASHTVAHSLSFASFPMGSGDERYPDYRPVVLHPRNTRAATILGELRVSKFLLERLGGTAPVVSFRPGYLEYPVELPEALAAVGYRFSSSMTANRALTHLPFQLNHGRQSRQEVEIFEIPMTVEDEKPPEMGSRVAEAVALAREIGRYGGSFVVMTHPNMLGHKLDFHRAFLAAVRDRAWFGSVSDFGRWWAARNAVEVDTSCIETGCRIRISAPEAITGLPLHFPRNCAFRKSSGMANTAVTPSRRGVVLGPIQGELELFCERTQRAATVEHSRPGRESAPGSGRTTIHAINRPRSHSSPVPPSSPTTSGPSSSLLSLRPPRP